MLVRLQAEPNTRCVPSSLTLPAASTVLPCLSLQTDLLSCCLAVTLQLTLLCTSGSGGAPLPWAALQWATVLVPLALMLGWRTA